MLECPKITNLNFSKSFFSLPVPYWKDMIIGIIYYTQPAAPFLNG